MTTYRRIVVTAIAAAVGWGVGWMVGAAAAVFPRRSDYPFLAEYTALPHQVPKYPDGVSFRFAMAHDVIHERFSKHGPAHYRERDRLTREKLAKLPADDPARFPLEDDLAAGLERLGRSDEAVAVMRDKLARQEARGLEGRALYSSFANLGTFLIHGSAQKAFAGDKAARERFRKGVAFIRKSVEVNPEAHFGREQWQAAIAEFLLAAMDNPTLLTTYDCLGNRLDLGIDETLNREADWTDTGYGRPYDAAFAQGKVADEVPLFFVPGTRPDDPSRWKLISPIRAHITKVGAEAGWDAVAVPSHRAPVPFDEPVLGIIGMWRQGAGANPHFALALGETMLRVGQRFIAWDAYERAAQLADRYSKDPNIQDALRAHCRKRQTEIEQRLPANPATVARLHSQFDAELAYGQEFQKAYQEYETARIAAGFSIDDPHFFDGFSRKAEAISSPSGPEELYARVPRDRMHTYLGKWRDALSLFTAGLAALTTSALLSLRRRPKAVPDAVDVLG